jgi:hypothetical protein
LTYLSKYILLTYHLPTYLLPTYLFIYLFIYLLIIYLPTYLPTYIYLSIYLIRCLPIYLWKKLKFKCCYTHWQNNSKKFKETCYMHLVSYCFTKWWGGFMAKTLVWNQRDQGLIRFTNIYYVKYVYLYIYHVHVHVNV